MKLSDAGLRLLTSFEGYSDRAYPDPGSSDGKPVTIGYGSTRWEDGSPIQLGQFIDRERAAALLRRDVEEAEAAVLGAVAVPLTQGQFDALVSFQYNTGALASSTLLKKLNAGDTAGAAAEFDRWIHNDGKPMEGLRRRRRAERALFETGVPAPVAAAQPATQPESRPMAPLVPALLSILAGIAPDLVKILGDKDKPVAERNVAAGMKVLEVARDIAGTDGPAAAVEAIAADPVKQAAFREAVQVRWYELAETGGGGIEGARAVALKATEGHDWRAIGYGVTIGVLALLIVGGGGFMLWSLIHDPATTPEQRGMLIGALVALIGSPVAFFFGSSVSSRSKDAALSRQLGER